jgi:demethylmenaquinone methyltransferase/2-methoxy-6-polyprenyl-1,4-benzoquinol methylase
MFDGIAAHYDLLNRLISLGMDQGWRKQAIAEIDLGGRVLDLGCGTGDFAALIGRRARATGVDLSAHMLSRARRRLRPDAELVQASAFGLPFPECAFDAAVSGFVLRNLNDLEAALRELARVLKPGAPVALVDATEPPAGLRHFAFELYFGAVAPALGALFGNRRAYTYLRKSLVQIPPAEEMCRLLHEAGFGDANARPLSMGAVTLFTAQRR